MPYAIRNSIVLAVLLVLFTGAGSGYIYLYQDKKIDKITAITGVEGQYVPERLVQGREREYQLPGFQYRARAIVPAK